MKQTLKAFIIIFILSLIAVYFSAYFAGDDLFALLRQDRVSEKDRVYFDGTLSDITDKLTDFDNRFYKYIAGDEVIDDPDELEYISKSLKMVDLSGFESQSMPQFIDKMIEYLQRGMAAKIVMSKENSSTIDFLKAYDVMEYNYAAAETMMRIARTAAYADQYDYGFIPDKISDKIINEDGCPSNSTDELYDGVLKWFMSYSALKASFDVQYLQVMFGKSFHSKKQLIDIFGHMDDILNVMDRCRPPESLPGKIYDDYLISMGSYRNKYRLAEYRSLAVLPDNKKITAMFESIYNSDNNTFTWSFARNIGPAGFRTLALVVIFELYSKNYQP